MSATQTHRTMGMTVDNVGFMVDRYGQDCGPLQFVRELTTNAIEAILATQDKAGEVRWEHDPYWTQQTGSPKLCITDTGIGMTVEDMRQYVNKISSSGREQSHGGNFGVGAKIAGATRNHAGLVYQSWKEGLGNQIHLWRDPLTEQYGLQQYDFGDGEFDYAAGVDDEDKPAAIGDHGTRVTLLGMAPDRSDNTVVPPEGTARPSRWLVRYLNTRYFRFPDGVKITAPFNERPGRPVYGMEHFLRAHSSSHGQVALEGATAHWWILDEEWKDKVNSMTIEQGHMAALYQDELYELTTGNAGVARLQQFGVTFGHHRVAIYVAPDRVEGLTSNTARTSLVFKGEPLPWTDWAKEFRANFPEEIRELIEQSVPNSSADYKKTLRDRINAMRDLMKLSRYRRTPTGSESVEEGETELGVVNNGGEGESPSSQPKPRRPHTRPRELSPEQQAAELGMSAEEIEALHDPSVVWVSVNTTPPTRRHGDELEDRAAKYIEGSNEIHVNADFRGIVDMVDRWADRYTHVPAARTVVEEVVKEWFTLQLMETVIASKSLMRSQFWNPDDIGRLFSPEALTASVMSRYHIDIAASRALGRKLGTLKEKA